MTGQEKKIKISELPASVTFSGLWTIGYQVINGRKTSVKVSLSEIQVAYDNILAATRDTRQAIEDLRELETTVSDKEEARELFYSNSQVLIQGWSNDEQKRKEAETSRVQMEDQRVQVEKERASVEATRKEMESIRIVEETLRQKAEGTREANEVTRQRQEEQREQETTAALLVTETATNRLNALSDHRDEIRDGYWWRWDENTKEWYNTGEIAKGNVMYATFDVDENNDLYMYTDEEYTGPGFTVDDENLYVTLKTE